MGPGIRGSQQAHFSLGSPRVHIERVPVYIYDCFDYIYDYFNYIYNYFLVITSTTP
jgi:hypothetical protein